MERYELINELNIQESQDGEDFDWDIYQHLCDIAEYWYSEE